MINAREEFEFHANEIGCEVLCAKITTDDDWRGCEKKHYLLKSGYSVGELNAFLGSLNFDYDSGYGTQELFGTIWYVDGTYSQRGEYDGAEWWEHCKTPEIPEELRG